MAANQQIPEVQGVQDSKVRDILTTMRAILNNITGRNTVPITQLSATADLGGVINKVNEMLSALQGTQNTQSNIPKPRGVPCFSAYQSTTQTVSSGVSTKVNIDTEEFDLTSAFDISNNRFNPKVAGYYQVNGVVRGSGTTNLTNATCELWKNGSLVHRGTEMFVPAGIGNAIANTGFNTIIYLNGTTDYIEMYGVVSGTGTLSFQNINQQITGRFSACWLRNP